MESIFRKTFKGNYGDTINITNSGNYPQIAEIDEKRSAPVAACFYADCN